MSGVEDVMARISEIEARFAPAPPVIDTTLAFSAVLSATSSDAPGATASSGMSAAALPPASGGAAAAAVRGAGATSGPTGSDVVTQARRYLGVPYVWGGTDPATGLDCSGLVQLVFKDLGVALPRVAADQASMGTAVANLASARPGDLVAFGDPAHHIGIYIGDGKMIDAPHTGASVEVDPVGAPTSIRRVLPLGPSAPFAPDATALLLTQAQQQIRVLSKAAATYSTGTSGLGLVDGNPSPRGTRVAASAGSGPAGMGGT